MTRNPFINAFAASAYIGGIVLVLFYGIADRFDNMVLMPMVMLSLLVLSVAFMGYTFFYYPLVLYVEGDKKGAVALFLRTLGIFAVITVGLVGVLFGAAAY